MIFERELKHEFVMTGASSLQSKQNLRDQQLRISGRNADARTLFEPVVLKPEGRRAKGEACDSDYIDVSEDRSAERTRSPMKPTRGRVVINGARKEKVLAPAAPIGLSDPYNVSDESKVSKQIRRLMREDNFERFQKGVAILQESILLPENGKYIRRNLETLLNAMLDLSHAAPGLENRQQVAFAIGKAGYISEHDLGVYLDWCLEHYKTEVSNKGRLTIIESVNELLRLENECPQLKNSEERLMVNIQHILELTDAAELLKPVVHAVLLLLERENPFLPKYFHDMVDILVGWHVDPSQPKHVSDTAGDALGRMGPFWLADKQATVTLLAQFLEDTSSLPVAGPENDLEPKRLALLVRVFNTVICSVVEHMQLAGVTDMFGSQFLNTSVTRMIDISLEVLENNVLKDDLIAAADETAAKLLPLLSVKSASLSSHVLSYITLQLPTCEDLSYKAIFCFIKLVESVVASITTLSEEHIHSWLKHDSPLLRIRFLPHSKIVQSSLLLYKSFLGLKNIHLLEDAYKLMLCDLEVALMRLGFELKWVPENRFPAARYDARNAQLVVLFLLNAMSDLASASSSIIVMWALKPSVFEVLMDLASRRDLGEQCPMVKLASLKLLRSHCKRHGQFALSSWLISSGTSGHIILPNQSPTSGHLEKIVNTLGNILSEPVDAEILQTALSWTTDFILAAVPYMKTLQSVSSFQRMLSLAIKLVASPVKEVAAAALGFIEALFSACTFSQDLQLHESIVESALLHCAHTDAILRDQYLEILLRFPPMFIRYAMGELGLNGGKLGVKAARCSLLTKLSPVGLPSVSFTTILSYVLKGATVPGAVWLENAFFLCWDNSPELNFATRSICQANQTMVTDWLLWEAANFCISNKLRTPFGKPNETFLTIENAVKSLVFELEGKQDSLAKSLGLLTLKENARTMNLNEKVNKNRRATLLVAFVDHLERALYNAFEGTALVLPAPVKAIRLFFRTNRSTCEEWFLRLRRLVAPLALEAGMWESAFRHASVWLKDLATKKLEEHPDFEKAIICCVEALKRLELPLPLAGFAEWLRSGLGYRCNWIEGLVLLSGGRSEEAVVKMTESLQDIEEKKKTSMEKGLTEKLEMDARYLDQQVETCRTHLCSWEGVDSSASKSELSKFGKAFVLFNDGHYPECVTALDDMKSNESTWAYANLEVEIQKEAIKAAALFGDVNHVSEDVTAAVKQFCETEIIRGHPDVGLESLNALGKLAMVRQQHPDLHYSLDGLLGTSVAESSRRGMSYLRWLRQFSKLTANPSIGTELAALEVGVLTLARKEGNVDLARGLLSDRVKAELGIRNIVDNGTLALLITLMASCGSSSQKADILRQGTKLLYQCGDIIPSVTLLSQASIELRRHIVSFGMSPVVNLQEETSIKKTYVSMLTQLSKWLGDNRYLLTSPGNSYLQEAMSSLIGGLPPVQLVGGMEYSDMCVGQILKAGIRDVPENAKAWKRYGDWCYDHGRKAMASEDGTGFMNEVDLCAVRAELERVPLEERDEIITILSQTKDFGADGAVVTPEQICQKLSAVPSLVRNESCKDALVQIRETARNRLFGYYRQAVGSYFEFLKLDAQFGSSETSQAENVVGSLRILDMLVKHPVEMSPVFELSVQSTSAQSWKRITPQLLARLAYPDPIVRKNLSDLLLKIGASHPELLIFPAVVGAEAVLESRSSKKDTGLLRDLLSQSSDTPGDIDATAFDAIEEDEGADDEDPEDCNAMKTSFDLILDAFGHDVPEMLAEVRLLTQELRRIVLLWDELWLTTLNQYHSQIVKNINKLELELEKLKLNTSITKGQMEDLARKKYDIIFKPILLVFETLHSVSGVEPSTPHEKWFRDKYHQSIEDGLANMREPDNPWKPLPAWLPFKQIYASLQARSQRKQASHLRIKDISPKLSELRNTKIVLPGHASVTIAALEDSVVVLPTKTRPKKLIFRGDDAKSYGYLFKGLEDLHLDERVMQILEITNTMLASSRYDVHNINGRPHNAKFCYDAENLILNNVAFQWPVISLWKNKLEKSNEYRTQHYAVVPLGARSGLIQWVPDVTPLFGMYKRWQQREALSSTQQKVGVTQATVAVPRPSELFYAKLSSLLLAEGISPSPEHRKEWPIHILVKVVGELMKETPSDLLAREIWCNSPSSRDWWRSTQNFARHTAVMSMVGHVIGLGDRHLDNILVNLTTGEVVHIDYNVCFEKGLQLRVPEVVPFRLTPNIQTALGPFGIEGTFRLSCEHVMSVLRNGKETLLTLLEAFLYDPLIDWLADSEHGYAGIFHCINAGVARKFQKERRELDRQLTHTMFDVRIAEIQSDWFENKEETVNLLPKLREALDVWMESSRSIERQEDQIQELQQAMALIKESEVNQGHSLYSIYPAYVQYKVVLDGEQSMKQSLQEKLAEVDKWAEIEQESLEAVQGSADLAGWLDSLRTLEELSAQANVSGFPSATDFLSKAGQAAMVTQCEQAEAKIKTAVQRCASSCRAVLELLAQYGNICILYPSETRQAHRSAKYKQWLELLSERIDYERCNVVMKSFESEYGTESRDLLLSQSALSVAMAMRSTCGELLSRLHGMQNMNIAAEFATSELDLASAKSSLEHALLDTPSRSNKPILAVMLSSMSGMNKKSVNLEATIANFMEMGFGNINSFVMQSQYSVEEMLTHSIVINEALTMVDHAVGGRGNGPPLSEVMEKQILALRGVEEMFYKCRSVVLPEALRRCQMGDPSIYAVFSTLTEIVERSEVPLTELIELLELHLRYRVMEMESPVGNLVANVSTLRNAFSGLIDQLKKDDVSQGEMLLLGLNGLCSNAEALAFSSASALLAVEEITPQSWKKIDGVREAKSIAPPIFSPAPREVLRDLIFVQRLNLLLQTLGLCIENGLAFRLPSIGHIGPDIRDLLEKSRLQPVCHSFAELEFPVRKYGLEILRRQLFGITSIATTYSACLATERMGFNLNQYIGKREVGADSTVSFDDICQAVLEEVNGSTKAMSSSLLAQVAGHVATLDAEIRKYETLRNYEKMLEADRAAYTQWEVSTTAFHWLYEDILSNPALSPVSTSGVHSRTAFLHELSRTQKTLRILPPKISELIEQTSARGSSVEQRLKWAAGANPAVAEQLEQFSTMHHRALEVMEEVKELVDQLITASNGISHFESMRTRTKEAVERDADFIELIRKCEEVCQMTEACPTHLTPAEIGLLRLVPPDPPINLTWIHKAEAVVSGALRTARDKLNKMNLEMQSAAERVHADAARLRENVGDHHNVISSMRVLLKQMGKMESNVQNYLAGYRSYSELCSIVVKSLSSELNSAKVAAAKEALESMEGKIGWNDFSILQQDIMPQANPTNHVTEMRSYYAPEHGDIYDLLPTLTSSDREVTTSDGLDSKDKNEVKNHHKDAHSGRNEVAVSVWRRVKLKLEGKEFATEQPFTVKEQVDAVIRDATNIENLSLLYEGWTPWV